MKKYLFILTLLFEVSRAFSQTLPNLDFETWLKDSKGNDSAAYWTSNITYVPFISKSTTLGNYHSGLAAIKISTLFAVFQNAPGVAIYGIGNGAGVSQSGTKGGYPYMSRHDSLVGYSKYTTQAKDTSLVTALFTRWNGTSRDTLGVAADSSASSTMARFAAAIVWDTTFANTVMPDSIQFILLSSIQSTPPSGSILYVDDLGLTDKTTPTLTTQITSSITATSATSGGDVLKSGTSNVTARGIVWKTSSVPNPTLGAYSNSLSDNTLSGSGTGTYTLNITGLTKGTTYYIRAYATNTSGTDFGQEDTITTITDPMVTTTTPSLISNTSATSGGNVTNNGGDTIVSKGIVWSTTPVANPTLSAYSNSLSATTSGSGVGSFTSNITGLTPVKQYYVRAYASNSLFTAFGAELTFTTTATILTPTVTTSATATSITATSAVVSGNVTNVGGANVSDRGVVWSTIPVTIPTLGTYGGNKLPDNTLSGSGIGSYTLTVNGLSMGTTYYSRAYATNAGGTSFGNEINFTTLNIPSITTTTITAITYSGATGVGTIISNGGTPVLVSGLVWSITANPTIPSPNYTSDGTTSGSFSSTITGLSANTIYHVRAYATNTVGVAYGNELSFTTPTAPVFASTAHFSIYNTSTVYLKSDSIISQGAYPITARGVVWDTVSNPPPTISSGIGSTSDGSGIGGYNSTIIGLKAGTTYYLRPYASSIGGTAYGNIITYTTPPALSCTIDSSVTLSKEGIFPTATLEKTVKDLTVNQTYTYALPHNYTNSKGFSVTVDSSQLNNVANLPPGLTYTCGRQSCIFYPDEIGCFTITGTLPSTPDQTYSSLVQLTDYGVIHNLITNNQNVGDQKLEQENPNYTADTITISVGSASGGVLSVASLNSNDFDIVQNFPNPFNNSVTIKFTTPVSELITFSVSDMFGREVYTSTVNANTGLNTLTYSANDIVAGAYYFTVANSSQKVTKVMIAVK